MELQHDHKIRHHEAAAKHPFASSAPPSASSSPAHEFSFAVSLQPSSKANLDTHQPPSAIDLTPADEIFFHGHLLPLHLLPNLAAVSPRSSTNSVDQGFHTKIDGCICDHPRGHSFNSYEYNARRIRDHLNELPSEGRRSTRTKAKSFSLFGLARRRKEAAGDTPQGDDHHDKVHKKKARFDMTHFLKRYTRMFLFSKGRPEDIQFSAPASMRTSPTNSLVVSSSSTAPSPPSNDSTMEELQAAIQAAIAHCKDSISAPEKLTT